LDDEIEKNEMCEACSLYGVEATCIHVFSAIRDILEDPGIDGRILFWWSYRNWNGGHRRIDVGQDKDRWRALVNGGHRIEVGQDKDRLWPNED
jgi:hypothetical protein